MSYEFYKIVHISSLITLITASLLLPLCANSLKDLKKWVFSLHGASALISFISGFGLIAKTSLKMTFSLNPNFTPIPTIILITFYAVFILSLILYKKKKNKSQKRILKEITPIILCGAIIFLPLHTISPFWLGIKMSCWMFLALFPLTLKKIERFFDQKFFTPKDYLYSYSSILLISFIAIAFAVLK